jgi:hypothetical protein
LNLLSFSFGPWLALTLTIAMEGCLVPQSIDPITASRHSPPRVQVQSIPSYLLAPILTLYPQGSADATQVPPCHCRIDLTIPEIAEEDPTVDLLARWFVDYDLSVPRSQNTIREQKFDGSFDILGTLRGPATFSFEADALGIVSKGVHVVTVVIAERSGFDENSTTLPNRAVKTSEGYEAALYTFVVDVKDKADPAQPTCPQELPSRRVCQ